MKKLLTLAVFFSAFASAAFAQVEFEQINGLENARRIAAELTAAAREDVAVFGSRARNLQNLASYIIERQH